MNGLPKKIGKGVMGGKEVIAPTGSYRIGDYFRHKVLLPCKCYCGWKGVIDDLLGTDDDDILYCPQCKNSGGWYYK